MKQIHPEIETALLKAVGELGQKPALGKELVSWFSELAQGNETFDHAAVDAWLDLLIQRVELPKGRG